MLILARAHEVAIVARSHHVRRSLCARADDSTPKSGQCRLVGLKPCFQLICPEAREKWRKIALRCYARILIDYQKLFTLHHSRPANWAGPKRLGCQRAPLRLGDQSPSLKQAAIWGSHADGN